VVVARSASHAAPMTNESATPLIGDKFTSYKGMHGCRDSEHHSQSAQTGCTGLTMIFGLTSQLALEAEPIGPGDRWLFGNVRFWVAGKALGKFDDSASMAGGARAGRLFLRASPRRTRPDLDDEDVEIVYTRLFGRFFEPGGARAEEPFERDPYVLDEIGESSLRDRVNILAVRRSDGRDRIIVREHAEDSTWELLAPPGTCDDVVAKYCAWVEALPIV
jgi:hypothetical protein